MPQLNNLHHIIGHTILRLTESVRKIALPALLVILCIAVQGCSDETPPSERHADVIHRIVVVMPGGNDARWHRTVEWALENIRNARRGFPDKMEIEVEWHDEADPELETYLRRVAEDDEYEAVVGPMESAHAAIAAKWMKESRKPLILPIATSTELQRLYAGCPNVWHLCQSDITQSEILIAQAHNCGYSQVSLLTSADDYGRSFSDWFAYQATELGITVGEVRTYSDPSELRGCVEYFAHEGYAPLSMLLFAPSSSEDAIAFDDAIGRLKEETARLRFPEVICSDIVHSPDLAGRLKNLRYEGVSPSASPASGFATAYRGRYGEEAASGEAHLFDAVTMLAYAFEAMTDGEGLNDALRRVIDNDGDEHGWLAEDMRLAMSELRQGGEPGLSGVTGDWTFDSANRTVILNTTYLHWILSDGEYIPVEYLSTDGGHRTTSTMQIWAEAADRLQNFDNSGTAPEYAALEGHHAVIVAASDTWANYRHQADAMAMYQLLRRHGYADENIIVIAEDNLADDPRNIWPGEVRVRPDGADVHAALKVDYHLSSLSIDDFEDIMTGNQHSGLPSTLQSDNHDNVVLFWCGHGNLNQLCWGSRAIMEGSRMRRIVERMADAGRFRKLLIVMDACYSGTIGEACEGVPGVLVMTAADANESSKADVKNLDMGIWLSNGFTRAFQEAVDANPAISMRDLYYEVARRTLGSHATIYNATASGNLFRESFDEYLPVR